MRRGTNFHALGGFNQSVVLDAVRRTRDGVSRVEIAAQTGLSAQTVSNMARRLIDSGIIREAGQQIVGVGKPRTILKLDPAGHYSVGVHIDPAIVTYVVLDLEGKVVAHSSARTSSEVSPDLLMAEIRESIDAIIVASGIEADRVLGIGLAVPGPIDSKRGMVLDPPLLVGWNGVALRDELASSTGKFVLLEKDVTAAAVAERWMSHGRERDDFLFFYYGTGVGVGIVVGHEVVRGATNNAGDAGHIVVDPDGPVCSCGRCGCLGDSVIPRAVVEFAIARGVIDAPDDALDTGLVDERFTELAARADAGDPGTSAIFDDVARRVASAIVTIVSLLDVHIVVLGGPYCGRSASYLLARLPALVNDSPALVSTMPIVVTGSAIGNDVAAIGAGCLVLDETLSPRPSSLRRGLNVSD